ncbi:MAG: hypothetical protein AB1607_08395 [Chloroflexota bacterium]
MKTISIFLALVNSIFAGILLLLTLSSHEVQSMQIVWLFVKISAATVIMIIGALTWFGGARVVKTGLLPISSLLLVALGAATTVWTFQRGITTGDMEYYMMWYGGSLLLQGVTTLIGLAGETKNMMPS